MKILRKYILNIVWLITMILYFILKEHGENIIAIMALSFGTGVAFSQIFYFAVVRKLSFYENRKFLKELHLKLMKDVKELEK